MIRWLPVLLVLTTPLYGQMIVHRRPIAASAICGDGIRNGSDQCDGSDLGAGTCATQGFGCGTLACKSDGSCTYDTSGCVACALPEAFGCDSSTTCFNPDTGAANWAVAGGVLTHVFPGTGGAIETLRRTASTIGSADQSAQVKWTPSDLTKLICGGVMLRGGSATTSPRYTVCMRANSSRARVAYVDSSNVATTLDVNVSCGTWSSGDTFKAAVSGTGASTVWTVYQNGSLVCTMTGENGAGANTGCNVAAGTCADSGGYIGIAVDDRDEIVGDWTFDNFTGAVFP